MKRETSVESGAGIMIDCGEIQSILECPICMCPYNEPFITSCGHTFCRVCIEECTNRKSQCPECNSALCQGESFKNYQIERVLRTLREQREKGKGELLEGMVQGIDLQVGKGGILNSPIAQCFKLNLKDSLIRFERYYDELLSDVSELKKKIKAKYAMQLLRKSGDVRVEKEHFLQTETLKEEELGQVNNKFQNSLDYLLDSYNHYMQNVIPEPKMLPIRVKVKVPAKNVLLDTFYLKPYDTCFEVRQGVIKYFENSGNPVKKFGVDSHFVIVGALHMGNGIKQEEIKIDTDMKYNLDEVVIIKDETRPIHSYNIVAGSTIVLVGGVRLQSDEPKPCFTYKFNKENKAVVNYYTCNTCEGLNWVCEYCASVCHKNHDLKEYLMAHVPSWACCYCVKKGVCKLPNKSNPNAPLLEDNL